MCAEELFCSLEFNNSVTKIFTHDEKVLCMLAWLKLTVLGLKGFQYQISVEKPENFL